MFVITGAPAIIIFKHKIEFDDRFELFSPRSTSQTRFYEGLATFLAAARGAQIYMNCAVKYYLAKDRGLARIFLSRLFYTFFYFSDI